MADAGLREMGCRLGGWDFGIESGREADRPTLDSELQQRPQISDRVGGGKWHLLPASFSQCPLSPSPRVISISQFIEKGVDYTD